MSDFDSLREDMENGPLAPIMGLISAIEAGQKTDETLGKWLKECSDEIVSLWADNAALRDELHAVANRVESLTRAVLADPHDVAAKMIGADFDRGLRAITGDDAS